MKMKNSANVFLGFLAGAAAGATVGILLAPDKGKNTRQSIATKAVQLKDNVGASVQKGVEKLSTFKDSVFSLINKGEESATTESVNSPNIS
jgi:gas vesicle protein